MPTIKFVNEKKEIQVPVGANLRTEAMRAGVQIYPSMHKVVHCPGVGLCHTCRVLVTAGGKTKDGKHILLTIGSDGISACGAAVAKSARRLQVTPVCFDS